MSALVQTAGGLGLFLFGMALMTSGLKKLAGERLRHWLERSTRDPITGAVTGAAVTALIQSSSATTVMAIGFVGAGLMSFTASLGILFGANIGTTITGWMVALLGFELELAEAALPLLFLAALAYLFKSKPSIHSSGKALAGFCLLFIGIGYLQSGLEGYREVVDFSQWSATSFGGRLVLVVIGIVLTLITQSSSATVATALTALNTAILDLPQAAALIIGADIGTTGTAALATVGGTTSARRTGFAHVIYNLMTGIGAFLLLPLYLFSVEGIWPVAIEESAEVVAVGFHSLFNVLGVVVALPFTRRFGRLIERIFPEKTPALAAPFDPKLLEDPRAALSGLVTGVVQLAQAALLRAETALDGKRVSSTASLSEILAAVDAGRDFAVRVGAGGVEEAQLDAQRIFDCIHVIDHVERLANRTASERRARSVSSDPDLRASALEVAAMFERQAVALASKNGLDESSRALVAAAKAMEEDKSQIRQGFIQSAGSDDMSGERLDALLDGHRWLRRMTYHAARIAHYANQIV